MDEMLEKENRRLHLLHVCLRLFVRQGYEGTTTRDITREADISTGLLFHYFPTKSAVLDEIARISCNGILPINRLLKSGQPPLILFETISQRIFASFHDPFYTHLFLMANQIKTIGSIPASSKSILATYDNISDSLPPIIQGQHVGQIRKGNPNALALAFWGSIQGIAESVVWYPEIPIPDPDWVVDILRG
ncbi:MAG: helix-turn-helix transcriptional regulator [Candidatus Delongbacteria bacterium]|nr:helix-turn-helix transcriptional regulator [Candidatus Delongbacteria bacterium]